MNANALNATGLLGGWAVRL